MWVFYSLATCMNNSIIILARDHVYMLSQKVNLALTYLSNHIRLLHTNNNHKTHTHAFTN